MSREFTNEKKVRILLERYYERYYERYGSDLTIVSGGCPDGADFLAKKVTLDMGLKYVEFPPIHRPHNCYCINPAEEYNKSYHVSHYFTRNTQIAEYCDHLVAFTIESVKCNGTMDTFNKAVKFGKKVLINQDKA